MISFATIQNQFAMPNKKSTLVYRTDLVSVGIGQGRKELVPYLYSQTDYDPEGRVLLQCNYNPAGLVLEKVVFEYDESGRPVHETYYTDDVDPTEEKSVEYDASGKISTERKHYLDGSFDTVEFHYHADGLLMEKVTMNDEGEEELRETISYEQGRVVLRERMEAGGTQLLREEFGYDEAGKMILHIRNDEETGEFFKLRLTYDESGNKQKEELFDEADKLVETTLFDSDEQGRVLKTVEDDGRSLRIKQFRFDDNGNNLGYEETNGSGDRMVVVEHSFDESNNPLTSLVFVNGGYRTQSQHYELNYHYEWFD
jgi:hypothetical protein